MSKIQDITVVNGQGTVTYRVGMAVNGMKLDRIINNSLEYENSIEFIYCGLTEDGKLIFELVNVPVDIKYMAQE